MASFLQIFKNQAGKKCLHAKSFETNCSFNLSTWPNFGIRAATYTVSVLHASTALDFMLVKQFCHANEMV